MAYPRAGPGRPKGSLNKTSITVRAVFEANNFNPIQHMIDLVKSKTLNTDQEITVSKELAKYYAPQLKAVEHSAVKEVDAGTITLDHVSPEAKKALAQAYASFPDGLPTLAEFEESNPKHDNQDH